MKNNDIQQQVKDCYDQIKSAQQKLEYLRSICKHEHTEQTVYSYRPGVTDIVEACTYCGEITHKE